MIVERIMAGVIKMVGEFDEVVVACIMKLSQKSARASEHSRLRLRQINARTSCLNSIAQNSMDMQPRALVGLKGFHLKFTKPFILGVH